MESMRDFMIHNYKGDPDSEEFVAMKKSLYPSRELDSMRKRQEQEGRGALQVVTGLIEGNNHGSLPGSSKPSAPAESAECKDADPGVRRLMSLIQEAGASDVCQEFVDQNPSDTSDNANQTSNLKKRVALTKLIKQQKTELRKLEDRLDKRIEEEGSASKKSSSETISEQIFDLQKEITREKEFILQLEDNLEKIVTQGFRKN